MKTINDWARVWGVHPECLDDLFRVLGVAPYPPQIPHGLNDPDGSEARQQSRVQLAAPTLGMRLYRNNSGAFTADDGRLVRYGLGNTSKQVNEVFKSPDLVGWERVLIGPEHVGTVIGRFVGIEMKHEGWKFSPTDKHEAAQFNFIKLAIADGCRAMFATGPECL